MVELGEIRLPLPRLGTLAMRPALLGPEESVARLEEVRRPSAATILGLACGDVSGFLFVEQRFALCLVNAVLGISVPVVAGPLSRIERGVLEGLLAAILGQLGFGPELSLSESGDVEVPPGARAIEILADLHGQRGRSILCGSVEFLVEAWRSRQERPGAGLGSACLEIARTRVPAAQLATAAAGDTVVFDEERCLSPREPWPVRIRCGEVALPAHVDPDGALCLDQRVDLGGRAALTQSDRGARDAKSAENLLAGEEEAGPRVEVVATIARIESRELAGLVRGALAGVSRTQTVLLRVGATAWAEGELVELGGSPGVRITRKLAG